MKTRFRFDDLTYGVLLAALIAFVFATVLDGVRTDDLTGMRAAATTLAGPQLAAATAAKAPSAAR